MNAVMHETVSVVAPFFFTKSLIVGIFFSAHFKFILAFSIATTRPLFEPNFCPSANFSILSIDSCVVARDANCDKIVATSAVSSNLEIWTERMLSIEWNIFHFTVAHSTYALSISLCFSMTKSATKSRFCWCVIVDTRAACLSCNRMSSDRMSSKYF